LLLDLDDRRFAVRQKASAELTRLGEAALPALKLALAGDVSLEARRRGQRIVDELTTPSGDRLRGLRAVEVLENIGTQQARALLQKLATGAPEARLTLEARASLERIEKRLARP
jgi:hypothetical protein